METYQVHEQELHTLQTDYSHLTNEESLSTSVQHISERQRAKPCVMLRLRDEESGKEFETEVLIDPASYKTHETDTGSEEILSYVTRDLATKIKLNHSKQRSSKLLM